MSNANGYGSSNAGAGVAFDRAQARPGAHMPQSQHAQPRSAMMPDSQGQGRTLTHSPTDGKSHILYVMYAKDPHSGKVQVDANCAEAEYYATRMQSTVIVQDAMALAQRPEWLTDVPTMVGLTDGSGYRGKDAVTQVLKSMHQKQESMQTVGIAKPLQRDANGFPAFAQLGSSVTNSAMLTVGSVVGINTDPSRYQEGKLSGTDINAALQRMQERRQQRPAFTNQPF